MNSVILCIETSENFCSVALSENGRLVLQLVDDSDRNHSQILTVLIDSLLKQVNLSVDSLSAVAVSRGPGSYTGLRIGTSVAKGICYAANIPLIAVSTLETLCYAALNDTFFNKNTSDLLLCPMIDARRMEVYMQFFSRDVKPVSEIEAKIVSSDSFLPILKEKTVVFFGSGADKIERLYNSPSAIFLNGVRPYAQYMISSAFKCYSSNVFEDVAYFEPFYLKNFLPTKSGKNLLGSRENKNFL
ncbi:MAG: tRNA (adenosine(37)-N6)-threonylcarbamoyltransferase complex dimerization subunit type 1 TsaB [Bacteroidales bacterium]|nr:tRNA (adenosine(37)-N6)-threonylcarbamoyltransferase complex dimerization subunit type 1 TsaB [Bacteroidales bacterium]